MESSERYEQLIAFLGSQLPRPVEEQPAEDGSIVFTGGAPPEVIVRLTNWSIAVAEPVCDRDAPGAPTVRARTVGVLKWKRLPESALLNALTALIKGARDRRLARYRPCSACGVRTPPEWMSRQGTCLHCTDQPHDTVH